MRCNGKNNEQGRVGVIRKRREMMGDGERGELCMPPSKLRKRSVRAGCLRARLDDQRVLFKRFKSGNGGVVSE